jgi:integral membrane sensor domain MASE1
MKQRVGIASTWPIAITAVGYFAAARIGLLLAIPPAYKASPVWPASGIAVAAMLLMGSRVWPGVWLGAFAANTADYFFSNSQQPLVLHLGLAIAIAVGSTLQTVIASEAVRRGVPGGNALARGKDVVFFFGVTCTACLVAATIGTAALVFAGLSGPPNVYFGWLTWWVGDAAGIVLVAPLIIVWNSVGIHKMSDWLQGASLVSVVLFVGAIAFAGIIQNGALEVSIAYLTVPLVLLSTFRFGAYGATASLFLFSAIAVIGTAAARGPFVFARTSDSLLSLQAFIGILSFTALALSAVLAERRAEERSKSEAFARMSEALAEVKTLRGLIPICAWCHKVRNDAGAWEQLENYIRRNLDANFSHGICPDCFALAGYDEDSAQVADG